MAEFITAVRFVFEVWYMSFMPLDTMKSFMELLISFLTLLLMIGEKGSEATATRAFAALQSFSWMLFRRSAIASRDLMVSDTCGARVFMAMSKAAAGAADR